MIEFLILILTALGTLLAAHGVKLMRVGIGYGENRSRVFWGAAWIALSITMFSLAYWILVTYA